MFIRNAALVAACTAAMLGGCAAYRPVPLSPADNARALESHCLDDPRLQQFIAGALNPSSPPGKAIRWRLTTLTLAALWFHPDVKIAWARLTGAKAAEITAGERPNPAVTLTNSLARAAVAGAIPAAALPITIGPIIEMVLETAGKREARSARARDLAEAARWDIETAEWQVRGRVRDALLDLWAARRRSVLTRQQLAFQDQMVELLENRLANGAASAPDVARERISRARIILTMGELDQSAKAARARLATAVGIPVEKLGAMQPDLDTFDHVAPITDGDFQRWRHEALIERGDVKASLAEYNAAQEALRLAVASQYPDIKFGPGYNYDLGVNRYVLDIGVTLPVFHQNQGPIAEAMARRDQAAAEFTALQARIIGAVDEARAVQQEAARNVSAGDALLAGEKRRADQAEVSFRAGQVARPDLVAARIEATAVALSRLDAVVAQRRAYGALEDALRRPLYEARSSSPPLADLSS
jgi:outer membrane protein TolC